jgi:hypothetical protein
MSANNSALKLHKLININLANVILLLNFLFNNYKYELNSTPRSHNYTRFKTALSYLRQLYLSSLGFHVHEEHLRALHICIQVCHVSQLAPTEATCGRIF